MRLPMPAIAIVGDLPACKDRDRTKGIRGFETTITELRPIPARPHRGVNGDWLCRRNHHLSQSICRRTGAAGRPEKQLRAPWRTSISGSSKGLKPKHHRERCQLSWEFRPLPDTDADAIETRVRTYIRRSAATGNSSQRTPWDIAIKVLPAGPPHCIRIPITRERRPAI